MIRNVGCFNFSFEISYYRKVDEDRSIFLSNLLFTVDETQIRQMFQEVRNGRAFIIQNDIRNSLPYE